MTPKKISIEPADASFLLGKCLRTCQKLFVRIKKHYKKEKHQIILIEEFCEYMGIRDVDSIRKMLN